MGKSIGEPVKKRSDKAVPDPWLLHPIRHVEARDRQTAGGKDTRSAAKRAPKKSAKKTSSERSSQARSGPRR